MTDSHDADAVKEFFDQWALYRKIVDWNYLFHREASEALSRFLDGFQSPFSFLDLGCGDAGVAGSLLRGRSIRSYTGIDLSPVALELASRNLKDACVAAELIREDFFSGVETLKVHYDVIFIGLSLHHLHSNEKRDFLPQLRRKLSTGGKLVIFDPVLSSGESRADYLQRWVKGARASWNSLSSEEIDAAVNHVTTSDFPEEIDTLSQMAVDAGFHPATVLYRDPTRFYALMVFESRQ